MNRRELEGLHQSHRDRSDRAGCAGKRLSLIPHRKFLLLTRSRHVHGSDHMQAISATQSERALTEAGRRVRSSTDRAPWKPIACFRPPSSSGLGYQVLILETGVRLPLGVWRSVDDMRRRGRSSVAVLAAFMEVAGSSQLWPAKSTGDSSVTGDGPNSGEQNSEFSDGFTGGFRSAIAMPGGVQT